MKHLILVGLLVVGVSGVAWGQGAKTDKCHVYVVDVAMSLQFQKEVEKAGGDNEAVAKIAAKYKAAEVTFPFEAAVGEEVGTTKHFALAGTKLFVTASVYYTDESMPGDSITLGIFISPTKPESALSPDTPDAAIAETHYTSPGRFRVKQYVTANSKKYLVGLECESK